MSDISLASLSRWVTQERYRVQAELAIFFFALILTRFYDTFSCTHLETMIYPRRAYRRDDDICRRNDSDTLTPQFEHRYCHTLST